MRKALLVQTTTTTVLDLHTSVCLMLRLDPIIAGLLTLRPDQVDSGATIATADELHLTLCLLKGDVTMLAEQQAAIQSTVQRLASELPPLTGTISGAGRFVSPDGSDPFYLSFDSPDLPAWRQLLVDGLAAAGLPHRQDHGYDPHITLAYLSAGSDTPEITPYTMPLTFGQLSLSWGNDVLAYDLTGQQSWEQEDDADIAVMAGESMVGQALIGMASLEPNTQGKQAMADLGLLPEAEVAKAAINTSPAPLAWLQKHTPTQMQHGAGQVERKLIPQFTKDIDGRTVVGIASVFGNVDSYGDICMPGSFNKTIAERGPANGRPSRVHHLWQHDMRSPAIAVITSLREVGRDALPERVRSAFPEAVGGLEVARTYLDTPRAAEVLAGIAAGVAYEMSYAYDAIQYEQVEQGDLSVRLLYEQRLFETSDVLWGANSATVASKSLLSLADILAALEHYRFKAGARHSAEDTRLLNDIHRAAVRLGCTTCKGMSDDDEAEKTAPGRADERTHAIDTAPSLELIALRLKAFDFLTTS